MLAARRKPKAKRADTVPGQKRFTLDEYHLMISAGILAEGSPFELLNGIVRDKMPNNAPHASAVSKLYRFLAGLLREEFAVRSQLPISIEGTQSEPEPDISVSLGPLDRYDLQHPTPNDVVLLVEVADPSLPMDRGEKLLAYAAVKIPQYWIVNIPERTIEIYTGPRAGKNPGYRKRVDYARGDAVPVVVAGQRLGELAVRDILG
jgi:Uma2 family endonuclease